MKAGRHLIVQLTVLSCLRRNGNRLFSRLFWVFVSLKSSGQLKLLRHQTTLNLAYRNHLIRMCLRIPIFVFDVVQKSSCFRICAFIV